MYIRLSDKKYPFKKRDIKALFPTTSFPVPFKAEDFAKVSRTPKPNRTKLQRIKETAPILNSLGHWEQTWIIKDRFADIAGGLTKEEQETAFLADFNIEKTNKTSLNDDVLLSSLREHTLPVIETKIAAMFSPLGSKSAAELDTYLSTLAINADMKSVLKHITNDIINLIAVEKLNAKIALYLLKREL